MVNRDEEKVRVHMNVVPRSTMNTNGAKSGRIKNIFEEGKRFDFFLENSP